MNTNEPNVAEPQPQETRTLVVPRQRWVLRRLGELRRSDRQVATGGAERKPWEGGNEIRPAPKWAEESVTHSGANIRSSEVPRVPLRSTRGDLPSSLRDVELFALSAHGTSCCTAALQNPVVSALSSTVAVRISTKGEEWWQMIVPRHCNRRTVLRRAGWRCRGSRIQIDSC